MCARALRPIFEDLQLTPRDRLVQQGFGLIASLTADDRCN